MLHAASSADSEPSLRVLCVIANPPDLRSVDKSQLCSEISEALQPLSNRGALFLEQLNEATEVAIRNSLARDRWQVVHLIVSGREHAPANYGTIALQASDGRCRNLTATAVAGLMMGNSSIRLVILQATNEDTNGFTIVANAIADKGLAVITVPPLAGRTFRIFVSKLYSGLLAGIALDSLLAELQTAIQNEKIDGSVLGLIRRDDDENTAICKGIQGAPAANAAGNQPQAHSTTEPAATQSKWNQVLQQKRLAGQFDVFLCHNSADKPAIKRVAQQLKEVGILPWLDAWEMPPGQLWEPLLEQQIGNIRAAAVFVGSAGIGPWQQEEVSCFLLEFVQRKAPVIPVLLADAPTKPELPKLLRTRTWVDFRAADPDPMKMLIWGITGRRPED